MSLVEAALLDQMRRVLEMNRASIKRDLDRQEGQHRLPPKGWCKRCGHGIGQTKPNLSGYCNKRECQNARVQERMRMKRERAA